MAKAISDEIKAQLSRLLDDATDEENTTKRAKLMDRYLGEPYGDEIKGRSAFVDTSATDAVDAILPEIMDVFTSAEHIVEFRPVGPDDEEAAKQETAVVRHIFWQENNGFEVLYTWLKEAMIQQNAYVWRGWVEREETEVEDYEGLDLEEAMAILSSEEGDFEVQNLSGIAFVPDPITGAEIPVQETDENGEPVGISFRLRCVEKEKRYCIEPFPQEDFFGTPRWGKVSLEGIPICGRVHRNKTKEDWLAFGFSRESLESLNEPASDTESESARHITQDLSESAETIGYLEVYETYAHLDLDGDGVPELVQIWCSEDAGAILKWKDGTEAVKEVSRAPISALTPYLMPHRHIGRSVVENVDDLARVKTVLIRQFLDSVYTTLYKRPHFDETMAGENLMADLALPNPGAPVRTGGADVTYPQNGAESIPAAILPILEKFDNIQEIRTGATRYNQGLDAESLNKTAAGMGMILNASQKKAKLIARTFAETGMRDLFLGIHRDLRSGPVKEMAIELRGRWISTNPRKWKRRTSMTVNIGMGRGDRDERRMALTLVGQTQEKLIAAGSRMVDESKLFATVSDTLDTFGMMGAEKYFYDPQKLPPPPPPAPPPPDPIMMSAQAQAQKYAADAQRDQARLQADERERERKHAEAMAQYRLKEVELLNRIQNERETLSLREKEVVMKDDLERDKLSTGGTPAVPYGQVTGGAE